MKKNILLSLLIIFISYHVNAQTKAEIKQAKKLYDATWINKKDNRYLTFYFDSEVSYVTVNDWTGSSDPNKSKSLDAYKAYIKGNKLILPAENSDHHSPYCEIEIINKKLIYRCNEGNNFKDKTLKNVAVDVTTFERTRD